MVAWGEISTLLLFGGTMGNSKPLLKEEVPKEFQDKILFETFRLEDVPQVKRAHKKYAVVDVLCGVCQEVKRTPVNDIRNAIRGRRPFPDIHRSCKYPGKYVNADGYHFIWMPDHPNAMGKKYVSAHIYAMSEYLGRPIDTKNESVHHIDGDHGNNEITNLQLRKRFHGKGQKWQCGDCGSHNILASELD